ncbi:MAG: tRNA (adenosine(37)-N6)-threonylcarbamoyltransferase complex ATPase subunit type 1 TsaE [Nitrospinaceae bacterium]|nr:tRNA (adenosine(37)-N6)-threonylcarbamoyltransferase complex ATPase subunit type 1 TsaE [Nitrospinaceae bacterium]
MQVSTHSHGESLALGEHLGQWLKAGDIVLLFGDLGSGKTTLTQGLCRGLGLPQNEYVRSPSFTLINEYQGAIPIYHIDLYRLDTIQEIETLGLEEILFAGKSVSIVEWAEKLFPPTNPDAFLSFEIDKRVEIRIEINSETNRILKIAPVNLGDRTLPTFPLH